MNYKRSIFTHIVSINETIDALYHTLSGDVTFCNKEISSWFENFNGKINNSIKRDEFLEKNCLKWLIDNKFLISNSIDEVKSLSNQPYLPVDISMMYIVFSLKCNLRCKYCFVEGSDNYSQVLDDEKILNGIKLFHKLSKRHDKPQIILYGGEPTLFQNKLIKTCNIIRDEIGYDVQIQLLSNGYNIDKELAKDLHRYQVAVSLSVDGPILINDDQRICHSESSSFKLFDKAFKNLVSVGITPSLSITIAQHNYNNLAKSVEWLINNYPIENIGFNLLVGDSYERISNKDEYVYTATYEMLRAFEILRKKGIYEDRIMRKLEVFKSKGIHLKDCGGRGNQMVLAPDGSIGPCQGFIGNIEQYPLNCYSQKEDVLNDQLFLDWSKKYPLKNEECYKCKSLAVCGGGCLYNNWKCGSPIDSCDERMKNHNNLFVDWALNDLYVNSRS